MEKLLITGEMRSGTTFLANFLNSQKSSNVYADMLVTLFMEAHSLQILDINKNLSEREKNVLLSNLIQEGKNHDLDFSGIDRNESFSWYGLFEKALDIIKESNEIRLVGVKRTREELYLKQLLDNGVKVIYCIRDPRDVISSAKNRFGSFNLFNSVSNWEKSYSNAQTLLKHSNFYLLKYEDLILNTEEVVKSLESFLQIGITLDLEELVWGKSRKYQDNSSFGDVNKLFDSNAVNRWKKNPDHPVTLFLGKYLGNQLLALGYESEVLHKTTRESRKIMRLFKSQKRRTRLKDNIRKLIN